MNLDKYFYSNYLYLERSNISGYGVFAKKDLDANSIIECPRYILIPNYFIKYKIYKILNYILSPRYQRKFSKENDIFYFSTYIFKSKFYIKNKMNLIYFIPITQLVFCNSSNKPNIEVRYNPNSQKIYFKTIDIITKDTEILLKY